MGKNCLKIKKEIWDARMGGSLSVTDARFSVFSNNAIYYNTRFFTDLRYTPAEQWNFEAEAHIVNYDAQSFNETVSIPIINARIYYYFLKGKRAYLSLHGVDLLNKNIGFIG